MLKMIIETKDLGNVEISEKDIINFPHGLYGFRNCLKFVLLSDNKDNNTFMWLQNVDSREPRFVVIDPLKLIKNYYVSPDEVRPFINLRDDKDLRLLAITTVTAGAKEVYANLKCPIAINARDNIAAQVILDTDDYPIRYYILKREA